MCDLHFFYFFNYIQLFLTGLMTDYCTQTWYCAEQLKDDVSASPDRLEEYVLFYDIKNITHYFVGQHRPIQSANNVPWIGIVFHIEQC